MNFSPVICNMLTVANVIGLVVLILTLMSSNKNDPKYHCVASQATADQN